MLYPMKPKLGKDENLCSLPFWNFLVTAFSSSRPWNAALVYLWLSSGLLLKHLWRENSCVCFLPRLDLIFTLRIFQNPVIFSFLTSLKLIFSHWFPIAKILSPILALFFLLLLINKYVPCGLYS